MVDVADEVFAPLIAQSRKRFVVRTKTFFSIKPLRGKRATRKRMLKYLVDAESIHRPYKALVISGHGSQGRVYAQNNNTLISVNDSTDMLYAIASDRKVYICSCETMGHKGSNTSSPLAQKLLRQGAQAVMGFTQSPKIMHNTSAAIWLWESFDIDLIASIISDQPIKIIRQLRDQYIMKAENLKTYLLETEQKDVNNFIEVLNTMIITCKQGV